MRPWLVLAILVVSAGCLQEDSTPDVISSYSDADKRFTNSSQETHEETYRFGVPKSAVKLTIKAAFETKSDGSFVLEDPIRDGAKFHTFDAPSSGRADDWFVVRGPREGTWKLSVHLTEGGTYAFGVYID